MAIHPNFSGLSVRVQLDDHRIPEHELPAKSQEARNPLTVIKYMEAKPGARFAVHLRTGAEIKYHGHDMRYEVEVDGL